MGGPDIDGECISGVTCIRGHAGTLGIVAWALGIDYGPMGIPGGRGELKHSSLLE